MVVGGAVMDITSTFATETAVDVKLPSSFLHTSCPGTVRQNLGGVGRNVAEAAFRSGTDTLLISAVGSDLASKVLIDGIKRIGMVKLFLLRACFPMRCREVTISLSFSRGQKVYVNMAGRLQR